MNGFVLLPDIKWDVKDKESLYLLAIARTRELPSMRELRTKHLPLLKNIITNGTVSMCFEGPIMCVTHIKGAYFLEKL